MFLLNLLIVFSVTVVCLGRTFSSDLDAPSSRSDGRWTYVGCYKDKRPRDLTSYHKISGGSSGMNAAKCFQFCSAYKALYMALQNGNDCRCDNGYGRYGKDSESDCSEPCTDSGERTGEMCGGDWSNSVYKIRREAATKVTSSMLTLSSSGSKLSFTALGDWGNPGSHQRSVAKELADWSAKHRSAFTAAIGDNFYESGVTGVNDPKFKSVWKNVYNQRSLQHPWLVVEGNHDYYSGNAPNQLKYADTDRRWVMPSLYYSMHYNLRGQDIHFIFLDTDPIRQDSEYHQYRWFQKEIGESKADWIIVIGHHPIVSAGSHGSSSSTATMYNNIRKELLKYKAAVYICGHDHMLQHLVDSSGNLDYVVSGSASKKSSTSSTAMKNLKSKRISSKFIKSEYGFVGFEIEGRTMKVSYIDEDGREVYRFSKVNPRGSGPSIG